MPQIFCLARSIAKSKSGKTPLTQMTPASQARHALSLTNIALKCNDVTMTSSNLFLEVVFNIFCYDKIFTFDTQFKDFIDPIKPGSVR